MPHVLQTLRREPALAITLCYLLVAMAGIFFNYSFYSKFGIPILSLSQIGDFLVAGIQRPMALLLVLSTFPLCWVFDRINMARRRRESVRRDRLRAAMPLGTWKRWYLAYLEWRSTQKWTLRLGYLIVIVMYGWTFVAVYANYRADAVKRGETAQVRIWLNGDAEGLLPEQAKSWSYLGAVANYVFVYDASAHRAVVLPVNNIARLEPAAPTETD